MHRLLASVRLVCSMLAVLGSVSASHAGVVLSEIHYNPPEGGDLEFVEIHNTGGAEVDLSGWSFTRGLAFELPVGTVLKVGVRRKRDDADGTGLGAVDAAEHYLETGHGQEIPLAPGTRRVAGTRYRLEFNEVRQIRPQSRPFGGCRNPARRISCTRSLACTWRAPGYCWSNWVLQSWQATVPLSPGPRTPSNPAAPM